MDEGNPGGIVRFFAYQAQGYLRPTRLHKLSYLARLQAIDEDRALLGELSFLRNKFGPTSPEIDSAIEEIDMEADDIEVVKHETPAGTHRLLIPSKPQPSTPLDGATERFLEEFYAAWGSLPTRLIVAFAKGQRLFAQTPFRQFIDLAVYGDRRRKVLDRLRDAEAGADGELPVMGYEWRVTREEQGFSAQNLEFPACITQADDLQSLQRNMQEALLAFLEARAARA